MADPFDGAAKFEQRNLLAAIQKVAVVGTWAAFRAGSRRDSTFYDAGRDFILSWLKITETIALEGRYRGIPYRSVISSRFDRCPTRKWTMNRTVLIDVNGAGLGWFVDAMPNRDSEFQMRINMPGLSAKSGSAAIHTSRRLADGGAPRNGTPAGDAAR